MECIQAAETMERIYAGTDHPDVVEQIDLNGVQAVYLSDGTLVIPGTNEPSDWTRFNFNLFGDARHGFATLTGDSGTAWHAGFLAHAQMVYAFAKPLKPRCIIGHSLGAGSAQIVGASLKVPTIAFAAPRPRRHNSRLAGEDHVLNICRTDDTVCHVPFNFLGFRHVGGTSWISPEVVNEGEDHRIANYLDLMRDPVLSRRMPKTWPL
ncbi:hypothetical protein [Pseudooceanicola sp. HF7]|uniref:hypothetical protein n=1 Tax=Pseudooceanicola sp. HF7 TaxID=2721560 RepID=UPI00142FFBC5|nr:hypothetical protein [Pseudooceanicola sp. HF7]NIZ09844.1 hypothetical protein [Pseudooceanicola sp. HF7]